MGLENILDYSAMEDILFLPSVKEGISLVLYEATADGFRILRTDAGGGK